ncbi:sulfite exporter TauE/SafE family protein [Granulosicoccus antarcticus]|uniref:Probable membrane transporter protein n=1 Tax=Granulosicoccus antarcticus IMCC3135 TaxID=1192854 RepID=A0A2Z2NWK7_9GAMM|nr:sulfite exporter TauE/SafE family protein [Granulosicoccus antarcticus]ASJ75846.1 hypothetical protein IMCC3135_28975 [Granulosicoccus antarcticus IMCC3135]
MLANLQNLLSLTTSELIICLAVVLLAGIVRGFSGFALSALTMAALALIIPPLALIPICFLLECVASALMMRGGFRLADRKISWGLAIGTIVGTPIGLMATMNVEADTSRTIALCLILVLALLQLFKKSPAFLATTKGLYVTGITAGIATGLASVGGMVVALYILAQRAPAARMRASLVMYLFLIMFSSAFWLSVSGVLDMLAVKRALAFAPLVVIGVLMGSLLFRPSLEQFYKRFCLILLMSLALSGLVRMVLA